MQEGDIANALQDFARVAKSRDRSLQSGSIFGSVHHSQKHLGKRFLLLEVASLEDHALLDLGAQHSSSSELSRSPNTAFDFIKVFSMPNGSH